MRHKTPLTVVAGALALVSMSLTACSSSPDSATNTASATNSAAEVVRKDLAQYTDLDGNLELADSRSLVAADSGTIVALPGEGATVERGDTVYLISDEPEATDVAKAVAELAAAESLLAMSQSTLADTTRGAEASERAAAYSALVSAQRQLDDLVEPPTRSEVTAAESKVASARKALDNLEAGASAADRASVAQQVAQAESTLVSAKSAVVTTWSSLLSTHSDYCDLTVVPVDVCGVGALPLSRLQLNALTEAVRSALDAGDPDSVVAVTQKLITAQTASDNAIATRRSAEAGVAAAQAAEQNMLKPASAISLTEARTALASAEASLDELLEGATPRAIDDARANVASARAKLDDVLDGSTAEEAASARASASSSTASVDLARIEYAELLDSATAPALFYGTEPQVRDVGVGDSGNDVAQIQANLLALGFGVMSVTGTFDSATETAVRDWQASRSLPVTGRIRASDVVVMPGPIKVESWATGIEPGATLAAAEPMELATVTPISAVPVDAAPNPEAQLITTQRVIAELPLEDRASLTEGDEVTIELPDASTVTAAVSVIGSVPIEDMESGDRWVEVTLTPSEAVSDIWTGASVTVKVIDELVEDALVVPVSALVSLVEGGYAVEVIDGGSTKLVGVTTGMYADGFVEITGDGVAEGDSVAVPA